jgi:predicted dithiol-disulfide oxidoreductase (DUF899 family)
VKAKHKIVSHEEWLKSRRKLLLKEKKFTRLRDELSRQRCGLPWEPVSKNYVFEGAAGKQTLTDLFAGRSQLIVYHFMFGPDWAAGCPHCSRWADSFNGVIVHLNHRGQHGRRVARAISKTCGLPKAHGLEFHLGLILRERLQFRFRRVFHAATA